MSDRPLSRRRRRLLWTWAFLLLVVVAAIWIGIASYDTTRPAAYRPGEEVPGITRSLSLDIPDGAPDPRFTDATAEAGIDFRAFAGSRTSQLPEDMGSGAAWGDYDDDGDDDLFLVSAGGSMDLPQQDRAPSELYENLGDGTFRRAGGFPETRILGMGAAWGDYDGDGRLDLAVTGYGALLLFRNEEGGFARDRRFPDLPGYWAGASWADFDQDGDLDLYVCGYVRYVREDTRDAAASSQYGKTVPYTLNPASFTPERNLLFENLGDGRFAEVAGELGVANPEGRSLSALWHDVDGDGRLDLYVANDISDNVLFRNTADGFEDHSHAAWVADYRGAMGLAAGDWNADGDDDLFVTHWAAQENALYDSLVVDFAQGGPGSGDAAGELRFMDVADEQGLGQIALPRVGWGTEFADLDADGWLDLLVSNGSTFETEETPPRLEPQPMFLFWNDAGRRFHDLAPISPALAVPAVGRGLAVSDYDLDGDLDFVVVRLDTGVRLFRNDMETGNWMKVRLRSRPGRPGAEHGALLVAQVGGRTLRRSVTGASYLSQSSLEVHFGLGAAGEVDLLEVHWPGGEVDRHESLRAGETWRLTRGDPVPERVERARGSAAAEPRPGAAAPVGSRERQLRFWEVHRAGVQAMKVEKQPERAIPLFREALELDPAHEDARYFLGQCLLQVGDQEGALASFDELIRLNPQSHRGLKAWGSLRAEAAAGPDDLAAAEAVLERALEVNPEETGVMLLLAEIDLLRGDDGQARRRLEWTCRTNPRAAGAFFLRGYLAWKAAEPDIAREMLARTREALGPEWTPEGTTSEGDVRFEVHSRETLLSPLWGAWDGRSEDLDRAFGDLDAHLRARPGTPA